jgi:uncharacterized protein YbbC (DUF1343 family)
MTPKKSIISTTISILLLIFTYSCMNGQDQSVLPGSNDMDMYLPLLSGKRTALISNHTSLVGSRHLLDTLLERNITVVKVFGPEHGFRGSQADGTLIRDTIDIKTGIPVISLYGSHKKPSGEDLEEVDICLFDIQDVGCRFYTYISTLTMVMEACAENHIPLMVLDRPNPNGFFVDGPVLKEGYSSFVGLHPVPVVYGMTIGEYARMVNGEGWLGENVLCDLKVIPCRNYHHSSLYKLPIPPSPNLPTMNAVYLYPSLCFFEGTVVSVGRGTPHPFEVVGHPDFKGGSFTFTPQPVKGVSDHPPLEGKNCRGIKLGDEADRIVNEKQICLDWLITFYQSLGNGEAFFTPYFDKLAGNDTLRKQLLSGLTAGQIRQTWQDELENFRKIRSKYLLYPENQ